MALKDLSFNAYYFLSTINKSIWSLTEFNLDLGESFMKYFATLQNIPQYLEIYTEQLQFKINNLRQNYLGFAGMWK